MLVDLIYKELLQPRFRGVSPSHIYATETSVETPDGEVLGTCMRKAWYRLTGCAETNPVAAWVSWAGAMGIAAEDLILDKIKSSPGAKLLGTQTRAFEPQSKISGKVDAVIQLEGEDSPRGCEIKTFYGYHNALALFGRERRWTNRKTDPPTVHEPCPGKPKDAHLIQVFFYAMILGHVPKWSLLYAARDKGKVSKGEAFLLREFEVELGSTPAGGMCPVVDGEADCRITADSLLDRAKRLRGAIEIGTVPGRDFEQTQWQCNYCNYKDRCWDDQ